MSNPAYSTHLPGGQHWSLRLRRGTTMTLTATEPDAPPLPPRDTIRGAVRAPAPAPPQHGPAGKLA